MEDEDQSVKYLWSPIRLSCPYSPTVFEFTESSITYDGYFYEPVENLPVQRILSLYKPEIEKGGGTCFKGFAIYHVEIIEKIEGKDTSEYTPYNPEDPYDENVSICLFPTNHITLRFRILQKDFSRAEEERICAELIQKYQ